MQVAGCSVSSNIQEHSELDIEERTNPGIPGRVKKTHL